MWSDVLGDAAWGPSTWRSGGHDRSCRLMLMPPFPNILGSAVLFSGSTFSHIELVPILKHTVWKFCTSPCYRLSRSEDEDGEDTSI